jgi:hypothetical protein
MREFQRFQAVKITMVFISSNFSATTPPIARALLPGRQFADTNGRYRLIRKKRWNVSSERYITSTPGTALFAKGK